MYIEPEKSKCIEFHVNGLIIMISIYNNTTKRKKYSISDKTYRGLEELSTWNIYSEEDIDNYISNLIDKIVYFPGLTNCNKHRIHLYFRGDEK